MTGYKNQDGSPKRLLILGGSSLQVPLINEARALGLQVACLDRDPQAPGRTLAHQFYQASTVDPEAVLTAAQEFVADGIATAATDMPMRALSHASSALNLPGPSVETSLLATDKIAMNKVLRDQGVPTPKSAEVFETANLEKFSNWTFPLISKPSDSSGSRGVIQIQDFDSLESSIRYSQKFSPAGTVIVQEFLEGRELSVELLCFNGSVHVIAMTDKETTGSPHFVESAHFQPSQLTLSEQELAAQVAISAAEALGFQNCAGHAELIITRGGPKVIEIGARLGGDFITSHLVPLSTGVNMVRGVIDISLGVTPSVAATLDQASAIFFLSPGNESLEDLELAPHIVDCQIIPISGSRQVTSSSGRGGHIIASAPSSNTAREAALSFAASHGLKMVREHTG